jgi:putative ABC transport system permease protein
MSYALQTLWHEKTRYAAGVGAVAFSAVLIILQVGLLLGLFELTSIPVDHTNADIWLGAQDVKSVDLGKPILSNTHISRLTEKRGIVGQPEEFLANYGNFEKSDGGMERCFVLGSILEPDTAGAADVLTEELRSRLSEPDTIVIDESDLKRMGLEGVGDKGKLNGVDVTLVGTVRGLKSLAAPWVFCSMTTARKSLNAFVPPGYTTYLLAKCESPQRAKEIAQELRDEFPEMSVHTAEEFSFSCRWYWLTRTKAGLALGYAALLGLTVGAVITAQSLYSATMASAKEFATLLALGIPRRKIAGLVLAQSLWVGIFGVLAAIPAVGALALAADAAGTRILMKPVVVIGAGTVTLLTALLAGLFALRSVRRIEPMSLLR